MNAGIILLFLLGALVITFVNSKNVKLIRRIALIVTGTCFVCSLFGSFKAVQFEAEILKNNFKPVETGILIMLCASFFLGLLARGKASKSELLSSLVFVAVGIFGILVSSLNLFFIVVVAMFVLAGTLLRFSKAWFQEDGRRAIYTAAFISLGAGVFGIVLKDNVSLRPCSGTLLSFSFMCLLCAFPLHFWLPRFLAQSPFTLAIFVTVLFPRLALVGFVRFLPNVCEVEIGEYSLGAMFSILGLAGALWCGLAGFSSKNLAEKYGYFVSLQSCFVLWAVGKGMVDEAFFFLFAMTPATLLSGIIASILFARFKSFDMDSLDGRCALIPRLKFFLVLALLGMSFFPGTMSFSALFVLLDGTALSGYDVWCIAGSVLLVFFACGDLFARLCFCSKEKEKQGTGDFNSRELGAAVPVGICLLVGMWPGVTNLLREMLF